MSAFSEILHEPQVQRWAMALMHFLWQGCFIVVATSVLLRILRESAPTTRYAICLFALVALTAAPLLTFMMIRPPAQAVAPKSLQLIHNPEEVVVAPLAATFVSSIDSRLEDTTPTILSMTSFDAPWEMARTWLVAIWFLGELILGTWLLAGMVSLLVVRRSAGRAPRELEDVVMRLTGAIGLSKAPPVFCASKARDAASLGFFKPWILVPSAWLAQMSPEMLEAVLAHELMHIHRHDLWVNLFQRLVEVVLFFHPAVWWLSRRIREERELCCDGAAVRFTGKRKVYAQTLAHAARQRATESSLRLATNLGDDRMSLLNRVQWVLHERRHEVQSNWWPVGVVAVLVPVFLAFGLPHLASIADETSRAPEPVQAEAIPPGQVRETPSPSTLIDQPPMRDDVTRTAQLRPLNSSQAPSELNKVTLPDYVIEPPDILLIEGISVVSKAPYKIQPQDILSIVVQGTTPNRPIVGQFLVEPSGTVNLGLGYSKVKVAGLTTEKASEAIRTRLLRDLRSPEVAVSLFRVSSQQTITGEHLVAPDGKVNLGLYGRVYVAGMTVDEGRTAIEKQLERFFDKPKVSLDVFVYNSKFYYIIMESPNGDSVSRMPVSGNETVLNAIAQIGGLDQTAITKLWISRPCPAGAALDLVLPIDWNAITRGAVTSTNYQLLPGDRLFVVLPSERKRSKDDSANVRQIEDQLNQYNRFVEQWRIDEAVDLAQQLKKSKSTSEIAKLIGYHADLVQTLAPERERAAIKRAKNDAQRQLAFELWRAQKKSEWLVRRRLRIKVRVDYNNTPLREVLRDIGDQCDLEISVDQQTLARQGVTVRIPISVKLTQEISVRSALHLILEPLQLTFESLGNGIRVTSAAVATDVYTQVYYVGDLIKTMANPREAESVEATKKKDMEAAFRDLIELITSTIAPHTWDKVGGHASLVPFYRNRSVVVSQTREVHAELEELVDQLRKLRLESSDHSADPIRF